MSRTTMLVIGVSAAVLGGAWLASSALTSDIPMPAMPEATPPAFPAPPAYAAPAAPVPIPLAVTPAPQPIPVTPPAPVTTPAPSTVAPPAAPPTSPEITSEFASEHSPEVERAWELAFGPKNNPIRWRMAERLFSSCLAEVPENARCQQGLAATRSLIQSTRRFPNVGQQPWYRPSDRAGMGRDSHSEE